MYKHFYLSLALIFSSFFNAQLNQANTIVEYQYIFDGGERITENQYLFIENNVAYYFTYNGKLENSYFKDEYVLDRGINLKYLADNKLLEYKWLIPKKRCLTTDDLPTLRWTIIETFKTILGYKCQKATADFRGKKYEAYFTTEIPISKGPWKFNGLPGLILLVNDVEKIYSFEATGLFLNTKYEVPKKLKNFYEMYSQKTISYKKYIEEEDKYLVSLLEMVKANSSSGTTFDNKEIRKFMIERTFEWTDPKKP